MTRKRFCTFSLLVITAIPCTAVQAGLVIGGTRFIYNSKDASITFQVKNTSQNPYLVQSKIISEDGKNILGTTGLTPPTDVPFIATPPLFPLKAGRENVVRIMYTAGNLPKDRESVFWLSVTGIPGTKEKARDNTLQIAVRNRIKLFYRPEGLPGRSADAYRQLSWSHTGSNVTVKNPTPYYVTLYNLTVNGTQRPDAGMVAPFSSRTQPWCPASGECALQWQTIDDYGAVMPPLHVNVNATLQKGQ
ncbi:TPA: molecular chaperone [Enterobacter hormaechei]|nr:molecular chaperone [Enterobacter hormaechei]